jgi:pimeloyl-ACP methyl ester carboxylesterase
MTTTPTLVLIHGSWLGGWCWREVADRLAPSVKVLTPTLTGLGDRAHLANDAIDPALHVRDVLQTLAMEEADRVIVVGHSYGSMVAHGLIDPLGDRLESMVVVDGFLPTPGRSIFELRPDLKELMEAHRLPERPWLVNTPPLEHLGIEDRAAALAAHRRLTPLPIGTHTRGVDFSVQRLAKTPRTFIHLQRFGLLLAEAEAAVREGWRRIDVDADHFAMLSAPQLLADALRAACGR